MVLTVANVGMTRVDMESAPTILFIKNRLRQQTHSFALCILHFEC